MATNEQVLETTAQENTTDAATTVENKEVEQVSDYIAPSEAEFKKAIQSASSKAKYSLLQELGISSVEDYKQKVAKYDAAIKEVDDLKQKQTAYETQMDTLKKNLAVEQLGVQEEYKEDLITLAKAKVTDNLDFKSAAEEILNKNPNWKKGQNSPKLGTEKSEVKPTTVNEVLNKKYPWIN